MRRSFDLRESFLWGDSVVLVLSAATIAACILLGGASRDDSPSAVGLVLLSLVALGVGLAGKGRNDGISFGVLFCIALALVPILQLMPLPPQLWTSLPGRELVVDAFTEAGLDVPWAPFSVFPDATWRSALALLPPVSVFILTSQLNDADRGRLVGVLLALTAASAFLGLAQVADGPSSPLRFYSVTNPSEAVGFFANRNHFSALLYAMLPFAAVWAATESAPSPGSKKQSLRDQRDGAATRRQLMLIAGAMLFTSLLAAQLIARSRAGIMLTIVGLVGVLALRESAERDRRTMPRLIVVSIGIVATLSVQYALFRALERFENDPLADQRILFSGLTMRAASDVSPFGIGLGAFQPYYDALQTKFDVTPGSYANHAHNDYLELWLETGTPGLLLFGCFCLWLATRFWAAWRSAGHDENGSRRQLSRAATIAVLLLLMHSAVDYPLRTSALAAVFAFACALMQPAPDS